MKITIPLQSLLFCLVLLGISVVLGSYFMIEQSKKEEPFIDVTAGNADIQLQACPPGTEALNNMTQGTVSCCDGTIVDGQCNGTTVCSLSIDTPTLPSCVVLLRQKFASKAAQFCPQSIPNYFENIKVQPNVQGCTAAARLPDGTAPAVSTTPIPQCTIYQNRKDNDSKADSCQNIKLLSSVDCPGGGKASFAQGVPVDAPALIQCGFTVLKDPSPKTCFTDETYLNFYKWSYGGTIPVSVYSNMNYNRLGFCSVAKKYYLDKSLSDEQLKNYNWDGTQWIQGTAIPVSKAQNLEK